MQESQVSLRNISVISQKIVQKKFIPRSNAVHLNTQISQYSGNIKFIYHIKSEEKVYDYPRLSFKTFW